MDRKRGESQRQFPAKSSPSSTVAFVGYSASSGLIGLATPTCGREPVNGLSLWKSERGNGDGLDTPCERNRQISPGSPSSGIPKARGKEADQSRLGAAACWRNSGLPACRGRWPRHQPETDQGGKQLLRPYAPQGGQRLKSSKSSIQAATYSTCKDTEM